jgi:hypothetical protein
MGQRFGVDCLYKHFSPQHHSEVLVFPALLSCSSVGRLSRLELFFGTRSVCLPLFVADLYLSRVYRASKPSEALAWAWHQAPFRTSCYILARAPTRVMKQRVLAEYSVASALGRVRTARRSSCKSASIQRVMSICEF